MDVPHQFSPSFSWTNTMSFWPGISTGTPFDRFCVMPNLSPAMAHFWMERGKRGASFFHTSLVEPSIGALVRLWINVLESGYVSVTPDGVWQYDEAQALIVQHAPVVFLASAAFPTAVLSSPPLLQRSAPLPRAVFSKPLSAPSRGRWCRCRWCC